MELAGKILATSEGGVIPIVLDGEYLSTIGTEDFGGTFPGSFTGHPHVDPATGETHAIAYYWEWNHLKYLVFNREGTVRSITRVPAPTRPIVHDFAMSQRFAIVLDSPLAFDGELAAQGYYGVRWHDELPSEFVFIPRAGVPGNIRRIPVPQQAIFHFVNAYDLPNGLIVVDAVSNDCALKVDRHGPLEGRLTMNRFTIDPIAGTVHTLIVSEVPQELPRIDDRKFSQPHRYSYSWGVGEAGSLLKIDYATNQTEQYRCELGTYPSEPVFQPARQDAAEDEGWILSYIGDLRTNRSELGIFAAIDLGSESAGYALLEPWVSFFDLYEHLQKSGSNLCASPPELGWGSVVGNALEHGVGYTPYGDHWGFHCGMEVVLADGDVARTGMGAMSNSNAWQLFQYGYGPYLDGLFTQSNYGVVTKLGMWLMPRPPAARAYILTFPRGRIWKWWSRSRGRCGWP